MYNGIINIYKEKGFTSHDVVAKLRGILKQKKIGHTGTLDPDAVGVLPVCLGKATRLCEMLTDKEKAYEAEMILGKETDTQDIWGKVLKETDVLSIREKISDEDIKKCILGFEGDYDQIPPMYSAIKINGKRLYELAREGVEVERKPRKITIHYIKIISVEYPVIRMEISCSKGTYIRTLCHDIGQKLGTGACMTELKRIRSGKFDIQNALTLEQVEKLAKEESLEEHLVSIESMFTAYARVDVSEKYAKLLHNGNELPIKTGLEDGTIVRVYDENSEFVGLYKVINDKGTLRPEKIFNI